MSIVQKYKDKINELNLLVGPLGLKKLSLNKSPARSSYYLDKDSKGVESDHIIIFKMRNEKSFAFAFNYAEVETPFLVVTFKEKEIIRSAKLSETSFKEGLKQFVSVVKVLAVSNALSEVTLENTFLTQFIKGQELDVDAEVNAVVEKLKPQLKSLMEKNKESLQEKKELEEKISKAKKEVKEAVDAESLKVNLQDLRKQYEDAVNKVHKAEEKAKKKHKLEENEQKMWSLRSKLYSYENEREKLIQKESQVIPKAHRDKVRGKI